MKKNSKVILVGVLLIALVLVVTSVSVAWVSNGNTYAAKIERANRYLESGDYDNAVLMFRAAIDQDETQAEAYYGLYRAYYALGEMELAETALRVGLQTTKEPYLQELLDKFESQLLVVENVEGVGNPDDKAATPVLNTALLTLLSTATYSDYGVKYDDISGTYSNGDYTQHIDAIGATLTYSGDRVDTSRAVPYGTSVPNKIVMDNVMSLFGGVDSITFDKIKSFGSITGAVKNDRSILFMYNDCEVNIQCDANGNVTAESENSLIPVQREIEEEQVYTVALTIKSAVDNSPVVGAKVTMYQGSLQGAHVEGNTNSVGEVLLEVNDSGTYVAVVEKDGFIREEFNVDVLSGATTTEEELHISPVMSSDTIRFVLTWGGSPRDLDSHLIGTSSSGSYVHTSYMDQESMKNGTLISELDVDDRDGYGPETMTLYDTAGDYEFVVDDYMNSGMISSSGATVKIYVGSSLYSTVSIPAGVDDVWHVCTVRNGAITVTNRNDTSRTFR